MLAQGSTENFPALSTACWQMTNSNCKGTGKGKECKLVTRQQDSAVGDISSVPWRHVYSFATTTEGVTFSKAVVLSPQGTILIKNVHQTHHCLFLKEHRHPFLLVVYFLLCKDAQDSVDWAPLWPLSNLEFISFLMQCSFGFTNRTITVTCKKCHDRHKKKKLQYHYQCIFCCHSSSWKGLA